MLPLRELVAEKDKQTKDKPSDETAEKNCKHLNSLLKLITDCESMNDNHIKVWINEEKEQLTDKNIVDP